MNKKEIFKRIYESEKEDAGLKVGKRYEISLENLYDEFGPSLSSGVSIEKERHDMEDFYTLYQGDKVVLLDGEDVILKSINDGKFTFSSPTWGKFSLNRDEVEEGIVASSKDSYDDETEGRDYGFYQNLLNKARDFSHSHAQYSDEEMKNGRIRVVQGEKRIKDSPLDTEIDRSEDEERVANELYGAQTAWQKASNPIRRFVQDVRTTFMNSSPFGMEFLGLEYSRHTGFQITIYASGPKHMLLAEEMEKSIQKMLDEKGYSDINIVIAEDKFAEEEGGGCYLNIYLNEYLEPTIEYNPHI